MGVFVVNPESSIIDLVDEMQRIICSTEAISDTAAGVWNEKGQVAFSKPAFSGYMDQVSRNMDMLKQLTLSIGEKWRSDFRIK